MKTNYYANVMEGRRIKHLHINGKKRYIKFDKHTIKFEDIENIEYNLTAGSPKATEVIGGAMVLGVVGAIAASGQKKYCYLIISTIGGNKLVINGQYGGEQGGVLQNVLLELRDELGLGQN